MEDITTGSGAIKPRRTSKACSSCHMRKVRCDVLRAGQPCTPCRNSSLACKLHERKRRQRKSAPTLGKNGQTGKWAHGHVHRRPLPEHMMLHRVPFYPSILTLAPNDRANLLAKDTGRGIILPTAIENSKALSEEDLEFLKRKGALRLPEREILDECVTSYFATFHPFFPIIDRLDFLKQYGDSNQESVVAGQGPSLLLLQGIVFTACSVRMTLQFDMQYAMLTPPVHLQFHHLEHGLHVQPRGARLFPLPCSRKNVPPTACFNYTKLLILVSIRIRLRAR